MAPKTQTGLFISPEGGEDSGKSTQIKRLQSWLQERLPGTQIITTREPGGTPSAEAIRALLVTGTPDSLTAKTEALLMLASRVEHVERLILPKLAQGAIILCDRYADSSFVYQTITGGYNEAELSALHKVSIGAMTPDKTFLMDLPPLDGLARAGERASQIEDRFEAKGLAYHEKVRAGYLAIAKNEAERVTVIDASASMDDIFSELQEAVTKLLGERGLA